MGQRLERSPQATDTSQPQIARSILEFSYSALSKSVRQLLSCGLFVCRHCRQLHRLCHGWVWLISSLLEEIAGENGESFYRARDKRLTCAARVDTDGPVLRLRRLSSALISNPKRTPTARFNKRTGCCILRRGLVDNVLVTNRGAGVDLDFNKRTASRNNSYANPALLVSNYCIRRFGGCALPVPREAVCTCVRPQIWGRISRLHKRHHGQTDGDCIDHESFEPGGANLAGPEGGLWSSNQWINGPGLSPRAGPASAAQLYWRRRGDHPSRVTPTAVASSASRLSIDRVRKTHTWVGKLDAAAPMDVGIAVSI